MKEYRVIPVLLVDQGRLIKTKAFSNEVYVGDPINTIKIFNDKEVDEIVVLDVTASTRGAEPDLAMIDALASECFVPLAYGGGVNTVDQARRILRLGVEKIILNTSALDRPPLIRQIGDRFGKQSVVVSIDVKKTFLGGYRVMRDRARRKTEWHPEQFAKEVESLGAGEVILTRADHEGTLQGYDVELIHRVASAVHIPVIAHGGARGMDDFVAAVRSGASAVAAGHIFVFHGPHNAVLITFPSRNELETEFFERVSDRKDDLRRSNLSA
ncbi:MAG TPA: AglZ/HisF2 family acetamidino modification protein [Bdellovibrionota bacterium]|nr:AglZ/HisF2 family acetamidino modification protein [Bdellovibrionota bacterium]